MIKYIFKYFLFVISLFFLTNAFCQQKDFVLWGGVGLEKKLNKHYSVKYYSQIAVNQNASEFNNAINDIGVVYKISSCFSASGGYRFIKIRNIENSFQNRSLIYGNLLFGKRVNKITFSYRLRYQSMFYVPKVFDQFKPNKNVLRNKFALGYKINKKWGLILSCENYFRLNNKLISESWVLGAWFYYKINHHNKLFYNYFFQKQVNRANPYEYYISSLSYSLSF